MRSAGLRRFASANARRGRRGVISASASAATSRGPASGRSRARWSASSPPARFSSPRAPVRKAKAWRRSLRKSRPMPGASIPTTWLSRSAIRRGSPSDSAPSPAAPRSRCRRPFTVRASVCARKYTRSPPISWNARLTTSNCATAASASSACRAPSCRLPRWRKRRARVGITGVRRASMPGSRKPTISSPPRSLGRMRCMPRWWRSTSKSGGCGSTNTASRTIAA